MFHSQRKNSSLVFGTGGSTTSIVETNTNKQILNTTGHESNPLYYSGFLYFYQVPVAETLWDVSFRRPSMSSLNLDTQSVTGLKVERWGWTTGPVGQSGDSQEVERDWKVWREFNKSETQKKKKIVQYHHQCITCFTDCQIWPADVTFAVSSRKINWVLHVLSF